MAYFDTTWYCNFGNGSTTGYYAVAKRPQNTAVTAGQLVRQFTAPSVNNERVFVCVVAGTTANVTDATWTLTRGAKTTDGTATWQECTGASAVNGDLTNTPNWTTVKGLAVTLGVIIKRNNGASYQICTTAGTAGSGAEPSFSDTAGATTSDNTVTWTSLGVVGNFTGGQAPHARLTNVFTLNWFSNPSTVYVGDNHAETQNSTITVNNSASPPVSVINKVICHNHAGSYPPTASNLATGATLTATAGSDVAFSIVGTVYAYGLTFIASNNLTLGSSFGMLDNCSFQLTSAGTNWITVGSTFAGAATWNNCTVKFANTGQFIDVQTVLFTWQNTGQVLVSGSSVPAGFVGASVGSRLSNIVFEALDLSQLSGNLVNVTQTASFTTNWLIKDCKLNSALLVATATVIGQTIQFVRCDSAAVSYKSTRYHCDGAELTETSITRVGGAVDPTGQAQSRKLVTTANAQWLRPFKAEPYAIWNPTTGANVTVTVCGTVNAAALPNNDDIWMEVEYLSNSASPLGKIVTTSKASVLASNAAVSSDGSTWNNASGISVNPTPTFVNVGAVAGNTTGTSATFTMPGSIVAGNLLIAEVQVAASNTAFSLSGTGWTLGDQRAANNSSMWAWKIAVGSDAAPTVTWTGSSAWHSKVWQITGNDPSPIGAIRNNGAATPSTAFTVSGITTTRGNSLIFGLMFCTQGNQVIPTPTGFTQRSQFNDTFACDVLCDQAVATSGNTSSNLTATLSSGADWQGYLIEIKSVAGNPWFPFKLTTTLSAPQPQLAGYLYARVRAAKASTTYYIDPQITLS